MTGVIATIPRVQFSSALGIPLAGGKLTTYLAGTTTPEPTFQDQELTIANPTTITLDATGSCTLWLDPTKSYKFLLKNLLGVTQPGWPVDNISGASTALSLAPTLNLFAKLTGLAAASGAALSGFKQTGIAAAVRTVEDELRDRFTSAQFGAKGMGGDDGAALQAAIDELASRGGGTLDLINTGNSVYGITGDAALRIRASNIHIRGNGAILKLLTPFASGTYAYFPTCAAQNGLIKIYAQTDSVTDFVENISIEGIRFLDTPTADGSHCYNLTIMQARNVRINNCDFARANIGGIHVTGSQYMGATAGGTGSAYDRKLLYQTNNVTIDGCFFDGEGTQVPHLENNARLGVQIEGGAFKTTINNCRFKDCIKAYVREIGGIGTSINNPQVWTTASVVNGQNIASGAWPWPAGQIGTAGRPDGSVMGTAIGCKVNNPNIQVHNLVGYDVQRSRETMIMGGQIYNRNSDTNFTAVNGQNSVKIDSAIGRVKAQRHKYMCVFTNGIFSFLKPAGEDATYENVIDLAVMGCSGQNLDTSGVASGLNVPANSNKFQVFNSATDTYPRIHTVGSSDPTQLSDGDYHPGSIVVNSFSGARGNLLIVQTGGSVSAQFPLSTIGYSTGGYSFTTNIASGFRSGMYVAANGATVLISNVIANGDGTGTIYTYSPVPAGNGFPITLVAPTLDMPGGGKGTTGQRPPLRPEDAGFVYLDTTLAASGKPIFWSASVWVDALGNVV